MKTKLIVQNALVEQPTVWWLFSRYYPKQNHNLYYIYVLLIDLISKLYFKFYRQCSVVFFIRVFAACNDLAFLIGAWFQILAELIQKLCSPILVLLYSLNSFADVGLRDLAFLYVCLLLSSSLPFGLITRFLLSWFRLTAGWLMVDCIF